MRDISLNESVAVVMSNETHTRVQFFRKYNKIKQRVIIVTIVCLLIYLGAPSYYGDF
jgi:hypothetical protein